MYVHTHPYPRLDNIGHQLVQSVQKYFSISEAARLLGISAKTLRRWDKAGKVRINRTPNGERIFTLEDIEKLRSKVSPFALQNSIVEKKELVLPEESKVNVSISAPRNTKFIVAGVLVLFIALIYSNFILALNLQRDNKVLGVETFAAPLAEQVSPLLSPVTRFLSSIGNSLRLVIGTAIVSLLPKDILNQTEKVVRISSETIPPNLTLSSLSVSGNSDLSTATIGTLAVTNNQTIGGTLIVTGDTTLKNDLKVDKNITLTGVINSTRITDNKLLFGGDSPSIYAGTTNTGISLNANGTGAISIGNSSKGDIYLGGGDTAGTRCMVTNASGNLTCSGDITVNGGDILTGGSTLRIGTSSTTVNIAGTLAVGSSTTTITGSSVTTGQISLTRVPTSAHTGTWAIGSSTWNVSDSSFYINPASAGADTNLFGVAINGSVRFAVDAEGDTFANNLVVAGSTTTAATTIAGTLSIEGNTTIGDSTTDTLTINPATITLTGGDKTIDITGAATRTISILNSTAGQVANLSVEGTLVSSNISSGATVSGANTGDQTITLTGDVTGTGTGSFATTLANSGVTANTYGGSTSIPVLTVDAKGRITAASTASISSAWSSITNPTTNLSLSMAANTTTFTYNATTSTGNLFKLIDTLNNTGTGYLMDIETASGSNVKPLTVVARGNAIIDTTAAGVLTLGNSTLAQNIQFFSSSNTITSGGALTLAGGITTGGNLTFSNAATVSLASSSTTALNIQSGLLDLDTTNSRVGIGTTSPAEALHINNNLNGVATIELQSVSNAGYFGTYQVGTGHLQLTYNRNPRTGVNANSGNAGASVVLDGTGDTIFNTISSGTTGNITETMRIKTSGNVGIGTTSPTGMLHIENPNASTSWLVLKRTDTGQTFDALISGNSLIIRDVSAANATRIRIFPTTGGVSIGSNADVGTNNSLHVAGGIRIDTLTAASATTVCRDANNDLSTCSSSRQFKDNINYLSDSQLSDILGQIADSKIASFTFKTDHPSETRFGIIAEEAPTPLRYIDEHGNNNLDFYSAQLGYTWAGIKALNQKIATDEGRLIDLEGSNKKLLAIVGLPASNAASPTPTPSASPSPTPTPTPTPTPIPNSILSRLDILEKSVLSASSSASFDTLTVLKKLTTTDLGITGKLTQGLLTINGLDPSASNAATLNTLSGDLNLQNLGVGGINFLNGKVLIDKNGNLTVQNTLTAKKYNIDGTDLTASSIGSGVITAGTTSITIMTFAVTSDSKIFVTPVSNTDKPLIVKNKIVGKSFDVTILAPYSGDIHFDWLLVN